ncbi:MAG TPA: type II secretion system protein GspG [bacterium]|uniref:Bacterial type II secretion system protein G n=1 Tax=candidate division TA06 bacterium ADurb.Bin417 TaxID=1852828 RepID=A0A1V5MJ78_UNCT6|nr:MAG: Bacterial type II secretion system protein G [candidate division TA06 bacterium ADurb.Bin417]HNQ35163.1 type II secretion system protein GspG [bacterium]HNS48626.1 type II secretion system protein GspG [bacterium]
MKQQHPANDRGFTLLEILVVCIIILFLVMSVVAMIARVEEKARAVKAKAEIIQLAMSIEKMKSDTGYFTLNLADLMRPVAPPGISKGWSGPYLESVVEKDPWKEGYRIRLSANRSFSADYALGGGSSLFSWDTSFLTSTYLRIDNPDRRAITGGSLVLNGVLLTGSINSASLPMLLPVSLAASNNQLSVTLAGDADAWIRVTIPAVVPARETYLITSYGLDRQPGGKNLDGDITWHSDYQKFE